MPSSIFLHSRKSNVFGLAITITTCSLVVSQHLSNQTNVITKNCGEDVSLYCNPSSSGSYWYRLPPEKIAKIQNLQPDEIDQYAVPLGYHFDWHWDKIMMGDSEEAFNITIPYLSEHDMGLYTCLDQSETARVKIISSVWLNIVCKERLLTKTSYSAAPPYIFMRDIFARKYDGSNVSLDIFNSFRGYPKPNYFACTENDKDITSECTEGVSLGLSSDLFLSLKLNSEKDVTISFSICNMNGCFNDTLRIIYETENQTVVLQEPRGQALMMCIFNNNSSGSALKWTIKNKKETKSEVKVLMLYSFNACHIIRQKSFLDEGTYKLETEEPLERMPTYRLKIQNDKRYMDQTNVITKNCGEDVSLYCNIENPSRSKSYWYRLPPEKIAKIQNLPPDEIAEYAVPQSYDPDLAWNKIIMGDSEAFNITIPYLSEHDMGLYTCLDQSETARVKIISIVWLNIKCKERILTKTSDSAAPPYIFMRRISADYFQDTFVSLLIFNHFRAYPKPNHMACTENNQDITRECHVDFTMLSYFFLDRQIQTNDVTLTLSICNMNGCFNDTLRINYEIENQTLVLQEPPDQAMMMCISAMANSRSDHKWAIKNKRKRNSAVKVLMVNSFDACHIIRQKSFLDEGTYKLETEKPLKGMTTYRLKIQNDNRNMTTMHVLAEDFIPEAKLITYLF